LTLITRNTDYAIRALIELAGSKDGFLSARQIAKSQRVPYQFLRRILQGLIKNKLTVSRGGRGGGFRIGRNPDLITAVEIMEIFQGDIQLSDCMFRNKPCFNRGRCVLRRRIVKIDKLVKKEFEDITIGGLLKDKKKKKGRS